MVRPRDLLCIVFLMACIVVSLSGGDAQAARLRNVGIPTYGHNNLTRAQACFAGDPSAYHLVQALTGGR